VSGVIDLRSDTVTQPTDEMRAAMAAARVGDDGSGEDPTVNELEEYFAHLVGKESAVLVPSGVMANQVVLRSLTSPGDMVVAGRHSHVASFEMGAAAANSAVQFALLDDLAGRLQPQDVAAAIADEEHHQPHVSLVCLENTLMFPGGTVVTTAEMSALAVAAAGRPIHLDGARLFNAAVASGESPAELSAAATTVTACLSKGLCAPIGSVVAGPLEVMQRVRVERKRLGGAMRQAGFIAAAGLVGLRTMIPLLAEDHRRAQCLATAIATLFPSSGLDAREVRTNIVVFDVDGASILVRRLKDLGVLCDTLSPRRVRLVTHAGVDDAQIDRAIGALALVA
jgi:threonine aldolase